MNPNKEAELLSAVRQLTILNEEKEKCAAELIIAYKELALQNEEKAKRAAELIIANKELAFQNEEREKRAAEMIAAVREIEKGSEKQKEYIEGLEKMMFMTSHKLRSPIANILGVLNHLDSLTISADELKEMKGFLKQFARSLDHLTRELTTSIYDEGIKLKGKKEE